VDWRDSALASGASDPVTSSFLFRNAPRGAYPSIHDAAAFASTSSGVLISPTLARRR